MSIFHPDIFEISIYTTSDWRFSTFWSLVFRYHYYGIAVKETSQYYDVMYSKKGAAWVNETGKKEVTKQTVAYSPRSKLGTLLPEFPNVKDLNLPASLPEERVNRSLKSPSLLSPPLRASAPTSPSHLAVSAPPSGSFMWIFTGFAFREGAQGFICWLLTNSWSLGR